MSDPQISVLPPRVDSFSLSLLLHRVSSVTVGEVVVFVNQWLREVLSALPVFTLLFYVLAIVSLLLLCFKLYQWFWTPFFRFKPLSPQEREAATRRPYSENMPSPFPNSWFKICESHELKVGEVKPLTLFGQELVIFRGKGERSGNENGSEKGSGKVYVMDAYCPHLGAHLGHGGTVVNNSIVCPFHGWEFNGNNGECERIPYLKAQQSSEGGSSNSSTSTTIQSGIPSQAKVACWPVLEVDKTIYVWHDIDHLPPPPHFASGPLRIPNFSQMRYHGHSIHEISCHAQEIPENGADSAHLDKLHGPFYVDALPFTNTWSASWTPAAEDSATPHIALATVTTGVRFSFWKREFFATPAQLTQMGPGIAHTQVDTGIGRLILIETVTPVEKYVSRAINTVYADPWVPRFLAKLIFKFLIIQLERDIPVWNHKRFARNPMQVKDDGPLVKYRRWYQQFYSKKGTKVRASNKLATDW